MIQYPESLMVIAPRDVTSLPERMGSRSVSDIHHYVPVVVGGATKIQSSYQDAMIGPLTCEFMDVMRCQSTCVPSFHGALGIFEHRFQDPL